MQVKSTYVADGGGTSSSMHIGFNRTNAEGIMENIKNEFNKLGIYTEEQWVPLKTTLRREWVGPDELDFEKRLIDRVCSLYTKSYGLAKKCIITISDMINEWEEFQNKNTVDGSRVAWSVTQSSVPSVFDLFPNDDASEYTSKLKENNQIIKFVNDVDLGDKVNKGLRSSNSKTVIQGAVTQFVTDIKNRTNSLFGTIQSAKGFYGEQASSIRNYIEATGEAIGEVSTAIKDLNDALDRVANSTYASESTTISQRAGSASKAMEQTVNGLGSSRWVS